MTHPTGAILTIPESSIGRPSMALIAMQWAMMTHRAAGQGVALSPEDVETICDALDEIIPAVQTMEEAVAVLVAEEEARQPSAEIVLFRPRARSPSAPTGDDAA